MPEVVQARPPRAELLRPALLWGAAQGWAASVGALGRGTTPFLPCAPRPPAPAASPAGSQGPLGPKVEQVGRPSVCLPSTCPLTRPGTEPTAFWCSGRCSSQQSHRPRPACPLCGRRVDECPHRSPYGLVLDAEEPCDVRPVTSLAVTLSSPPKRGGGSHCEPPGFWEDPGQERAPSMLAAGAALGSGLRTLSERNTGSLRVAEDFLGTEACGHEACCWLARLWRWALGRPVSPADRAVRPDVPSSRKCW